MPALREPKAVRWVLFLTFAALFLLMLVTGAEAVRAVRQIREQQQAMWQDYLARSRAVTNLSSSLRVQTLWVRRFVTLPDPEEEFRREARQMIGQAVQALRAYPDDLTVDERAALDNIRSLLEEQELIMKRQSRPSVVELEPIQLAVVERSAELRAYNDQRLAEASSNLAAYSTGLQDRLMRLLLLALGSGLALAVGSLLYITRLERQVRERYAELTDSHQEMERLSARLVEAQETERRTLSRELHDEVGQSLGVLLVGLGRMASLIPTEREDVKQEFGKLKSVAEATVQKVRNTALLLRPSMLDDLGLVAALEWLGRETSRNSDLEVEVDSHNIAEDLSEEHRVCIYRVVQEALTNAARHSSARNVLVRVRQSPAQIDVKVTDDGRGFDTKRTRGLGILGMEERVKRLGGTLSIESSPGQGTSLTAQIPLRP